MVARCHYLSLLVSAFIQCQFQILENLLNSSDLKAKIVIDLWYSISIDLLELVYFSFCKTMQLTPNVLAAAHSDDL